VRLGFTRPQTILNERLAASLVGIYPATEKIMDEHRATGTAKNLGGKIEEGIGRIAGDIQTQAEGQAKQMQGAAEDLYGKAKNAAGSITDIVRSTIEERPYTAVAIALGLGWLFGRTHRPL
jgi:uncharacterized protein YjbJ (UPF0337 family)